MLTQKSFFSKKVSKYHSWAKTQTYLFNTQSVNRMRLLKKWREKSHRSIMKQREVSSKSGHAKHFIANSWFTIAEKTTNWLQKIILP